MKNFKMQKIILLFICVLVAYVVRPQSIAINTDGSQPNASAMLDIKNANKGILIPRVNLTSETDVTTIPSPAFSLLIFNNNGALPNGQGYYFWNGSTWIKIATTTTVNNTAWSVGGNSINPNTDFIGTTNNAPLIFKINNIQSGKIDGTNGNLFLGRAAGIANTTGVYNSFLGYQSGSATTTGTQNTGVGAYALDSNSTGSNNTVMGLSAMRGNSTGNDNTAFGGRALFSNKTGNRNIAIGWQSLQKGISPQDCISIGNYALSTSLNGTGAIAIGSGAMQNATSAVRAIGIGQNTLFNNSGTDNIGIGYGALELNGSGYSNTGIGESVLNKTTTGFLNTATGYRALNNNTTGDHNTASGTDALFSNTTGNYNTASGTGALFSNTTGNYNTANGREALDQNNTGDDNTAIGDYALAHNTTGNSNTALGAGSGPFNTMGNLHNTTAIGSSAWVTSSNTMVFGDGYVDRWAFGITTTSAQHALEVGNAPGNGNGAYLTQSGTWTNTSSRTKKENFTDLNSNDLLQKISQLSIQKWKYKGTNEYHIGPVAEDFYALFGLGADNKGISTVDPAGISLAAIKELIKENEEMKQMIKNQNEQIVQLRLLIESIVKK